MKPAQAGTGERGAGHALQWILVANASRARVLAVDGGERLLPVHGFEHGAGRLPARALGRDRAGWSEGAAHAGGAALVPPTDVHRRERAKFAHEVATYLEQCARRSLFDRLDVFATPPFLGNLHAALRSETRRLLREMRAIDLTHVGPAELQARIRHELAQANGQHA